MDEQKKLKALIGDDGLTLSPTLPKEIKNYTCKKIILRKVISRFKTSNTHNIWSFVNPICDNVFLNKAILHSEINNIIKLIFL